MTRLLTFCAILWAGALVSWVTWRVFGLAPPNIDMGTATAYATLVGMPSALGLWKAYEWARRKRNEDESK